MLWRALRYLTPPRKVRIVLAWLTMWGLFTGMGLVVIVYMRTFGRSQVQLLLTSWSIAEAQAIVVEVRREARRGRGAVSEGAGGWSSAAMTLRGGGRRRPQYAHLPATPSPGHRSH